MHEGNNKRERAWQRMSRITGKQRKKAWRKLGKWREKGLEEQHKSLRRRGGRDEGERMRERRGNTEKQSGERGRAGDKRVRGGSSIFISYLPLGSSDDREERQLQELSLYLPLFLLPPPHSAFLSSFSLSAGLFQFLSSICVVQRGFPCTQTQTCRRLYTTNVLAISMLHIIYRCRLTHMRVSESVC